MTFHAGAATAAYTFDNSAPEAANQVQLLAEILDPHTIDVLGALRIRPGWRCLDVGPGAGTITTWLADQVEPDGRVTAIDLDPRHVRRGARIDVTAGDIRTVPLPVRHFDLVHARLVLMHLPTREQVLARLVAALRPGGTIVISDWDCAWQQMLLRGPSQAAADAFNSFQAALSALAVRRGADPTWARRVPVAMRAAGLIQVRAVMHNRLWAGGEAGCLLHASNSRQKSAELISAGVEEDDLATLRLAMAHPETLAYQYLMITTTGRRPID